MKKWILHSVVLLAFTFSYSILNALLPCLNLQRIAVKMTVWTAAILLSYAAYTLVTIRKPIPNPFVASFQLESSFSNHRFHPDGPGHSFPQPQA